MSLAGPPPVPANPLVRLALDLRAERAATIPFPPGETRFSASRTSRFLREPLPLLLDAYERYGPVFTMRVFHHNVVWLLGPEANHHVLVTGAENFSWREGHMSDLMPLLGDGLLTVDGGFHKASRRVMLPAFHRDRIAASHALMESETERAIASWRPGSRVDLYVWARQLALRIAMRALFGLEGDVARQAARDFEQALSFWSKDYALQTLRGPGTPWRRMRAARRRLDALVYAELDRRAARHDHGDDLLGLLLAATDEEGRSLSRRQVRDEVITMLFAGHDTTTSTVAFLFHELARHPEHATTDVDLVLDETLRLYPPAWVGPRRSIAPFTVAGVDVPGGVPVQYSSWASHRLPDVWPDPDRFDPHRFAPGRRDAIPRGAYIPFGGGSRMCIGMRFGQAEIGIIARRILGEFRLELEPGYELRVRQTPTIGPRDGMPMVVRAA